MCLLLHVQKLIIFIAQIPETYTFVNVRCEFIWDTIFLLKRTQDKKYLFYSYNNIVLIFQNEQVLRTRSTMAVFKNAASNSHQNIQYSLQEEKEAFTTLIK